MRPSLIYLTIPVLLVCCQPKKSTDAIGYIERFDVALDSIIAADARPEIIAEGYEWSEGPLWLAETNTLIFSDVPKNTIYQWTEENGASVYLTPSGYTGSVERGGEMGSNGLTLSLDGKLVLAQHGDRRIALMNAPLKEPQANFTTLSDNYDSKKLSSPNDVIVASNGDLFFTDPPYGLPQQANDPTKETTFNGVYRISSGKTTLLVDSLTRPNGIAFFPGEETFIVANSDPAKAIWYAFDIVDDSVKNARIFYNATENTKTEKGLPDGLKIDKQGNVFATGPGGVWIFDADGKALGKIKINDVLTSNCALSSDAKTLFITADMYLIRVKLRN